jgi:acyl transferase domain-containing protein
MGEEGGPAGAVFVPVLRVGRPDSQAVLQAVAAAFVHGAAVDWAALYAGPDRRRVPLPTYAFEHQRYWLSAAAPPPAVGAGSGGGGVGQQRFWAAVDSGDVARLALTLGVADGVAQGSLQAVLPVLSAWRRKDRDESVLAGWRYQIGWKPVTGLPAAVLTGTWLVIVPGSSDPGDGAGLAGECVAALQRHGARVISVEWDSTVTDRGVAAQSLGAAVADIGVDALVGVVSLVGLCEPPVGDGLAGTVLLVQALGDAGIGVPLWVITSAAVAAGPGQDVVGSLAQAGVWGLGRVAALEYPQRWGGLVDLPAVLDERAGGRVCSVLAGCGEDQIAIRGSGVYARRLHRAPAPAAGAGAGVDQRWTPTGSVLVTGGTGAIGGHLAGWLARAGAGQVVLASRSGPAAASAAVLAARVAGYGSHARVVVCDVTDRRAVSRVLASISAGPYKLTAVMHTAAVLDDGVIDGLDASRLAVVAEPKVAAAQVLDELTAGLGLDAFVLFSSVAATWGSGGQGSYAAANAVLDALATRRRARGLAATSVAWGVWAEGGLADTEVVRRRAALGGMPAMTPKRALAVLGQAVAGGESVLTVADVDWKRFGQAFTAVRPSPLISDLPETQGLPGVAGDTSQTRESSWARQLIALPTREQQQAVLGLVRAEAAVVLGHSGPQEIAADRPFKDLGFDSLTAVELRNRLGHGTGLVLPATLVFDYPTPAALAAYLRSQLVPDEATASQPILAVLSQLEGKLNNVGADPGTSKDITRRLRLILSNWLEAQEAAEVGSTDFELQSATPDEVFNYLDNELGLS